MSVNISKLNSFKKKSFLLLSDALIIVFALVISFSLRLEKIYSILDINISVYLIYFFIIFPIFIINNIYQILLRYFDFFSVKKIITSMLLCSIFLIPLNFYFYKIFYFPRSISFIAPIIISILILMHRIFINFIINLNHKATKKPNNILIIGLDKKNLDILKYIRQDKNYGSIKAIIDPRDLFKSRELNGIRIYKKNELSNLVIKYKINEIIIGKGLNQNEVSKIFERFEKHDIRIKNLSYQKNKSGIVDQITISEPNFFDIINRPKKIVKEKILYKRIYNKNILVTGGGGSIGSELCLEILKYKPKKLYILEISEINMFNLINLIKDQKKFNNNIIRPILGNCEDKTLFKRYFNLKKLDDIYHAAAYKHVTFGEENPYSMMKNNIENTNTLINFAIKKNIKNFTFISSDKAVNPKSVLGYSKKIGEELIQQKFQLKNKLKTKFTIVRFGNVIGSSGSVIPIFLKQLSNNQPLTVTSKKASRYFMSISEAVQLVINASYLNQGGVKIYALDMGEQINIYEMAKRIIMLSGKTLQSKKNPNGEVPIKIIGLKKGEKLKEEITLSKNLVKTLNEEIMLCDEKFNSKNFNYRLKHLKNKFNLNLKN